MTAVMTRTRPDPDAIRMNRVRRGDVVAFAELVERYWGPVVGRFIRQLRRPSRSRGHDARGVPTSVPCPPPVSAARQVFDLAVSRGDERGPQRDPVPAAPPVPAVGPAVRPAAGRRLFAALPSRSRGRPDPTAGAGRIGRPGPWRLGGPGGAATPGAGNFKSRTSRIRRFGRRLALSPEATKSLLYRARQQLKETLGGDGGVIALHFLARRSEGLGFAVSVTQKVCVRAIRLPARVLPLQVPQTTPIILAIQKGRNKRSAAPALVK